MTIKEVCAKYNITADTLRYYEKAGVIPEVHRTPGGIRDYQEEDLSWVENAICMRKSGMSMEKITEYMRLFRMGDETLAQRRDLLVAQRRELEQQKKTIEDEMARLDYKISRYEEALKTGSLTF